MTRKKLPIGIQTFREIREDDCYYVDKTEFILRLPEGKALQQLKDKRYADKYRSAGQPIHLIGVEFSKVSRTVVGFDVETSR
ncbi:MAG: hypothetical protein Kow0065_18790 [Methylomicrobium sp.]